MMWLPFEPHGENGIIVVLVSIEPETSNNCFHRPFLLALHPPGDTTTKPGNFLHNSLTRYYTIGKE
ncbi:hypothetical protein DVH24_001325 [Malus domestica]|uniref:Uncharacterized protein n=1 Tax=Malus domestica TaxID=3750 RepID=A0A498K0F8_MALDO|nr:hypothetical protein DVH24_001325 [Malus domestica]